MTCESFHSDVYARQKARTIAHYFKNNELLFVAKKISILRMVHVWRLAAFKQSTWQNDRRLISIPSEDQMVADSVRLRNMLKVFDQWAFPGTVLMGSDFSRNHVCQLTDELLSVCIHLLLIPFQCDVM